MFPRLHGTGKAVLSDIQFSGLNETPFIQEGELADMRNLGGYHLPYLSPRLPRKLIAQIPGIKYIMPGTDEPFSFTGVAGTTFYYKGQAVTQNAAAFQSSFADNPNVTSMITFDDKILIFPQMFYFDIKNQAEGLKPLANPTVTATYLAFGTNTSGVDYIDITHISTPVSGSDFDLTNYFSPGDSITLVDTPGYSNPADVLKNMVPYTNVSGESDYKSTQTCIISKVNKKYLEVYLYDKNGIAKHFNKAISGIQCSVQITAKSPKIKFAATSENRVYGVFGSEVAISRLGSYGKFYSYLGNSYDSWTAKVATSEDFNGIVSYGGRVLMTKPHYIHEVLGNNAATFGIPYCMKSGCIDSRSIVEINNVLYMLSHDGVCIYTGDVPRLISDKIRKRYISGTAGTDGQRYYLSAYDGTGYDLLVYDTKTGIWYKEDNLSVIGFSRHGSDLYAACTDGKIFKFNAENEPEVIDWYAVSKVYEDGGNYLKTPSEIILRSEMPAGSVIRVYIRYDKGEFTLCREFTAADQAPVKIPVRLKPCNSYQIRIEGSGNVKIHELERRLFISGEHYK